MDTYTAPNPPTATQLRMALAELDLHGERRASAAMHLAMPVTAPIGLSVKTDGESWSFDEVTIARTDDPIADALRLAELTFSEKFRYHRLDGHRVLWGKILRSGADRILFGADLLFGMPVPHGTTEVHAGDILEVAHIWNKERFEMPAVITTPRGSTLLVSGSEQRMQLTPA
jgi:hypothetical protein